MPRDPVAAAGWFRKAADRSHAPAQRNLGSCFENGRGVTRNVSEALRWYQKAAAQGHTRAQKALKRLNQV